jgi:hypothetical protein
MYVHVYNNVGITNGPYKINVYNYDFPIQNRNYNGHQQNGAWHWDFMMIL